MAIVAEGIFTSKQEELMGIVEGRGFCVTFVGDQSFGNRDFSDRKRIAFPIVVGQTQEEIALVKQMQFNGLVFTPRTFTAFYNQYSRDYTSTRFTGRINPFGVEMIINSTSSEREAFVGINLIKNEELATGNDLWNYEGKRIRQYIDSDKAEAYQVMKTGVFRLKRV